MMPQRTGNGAQTITINVKAMDKDQGFEIVYYSKIPVCRGEHRPKK